MAERRPGWVVVSGAAGALGSVLAAHYAAKDYPVLAVDQCPARSEDANDTKRIIFRKIDILADDVVPQCLAEVIPVSEPIALLINAVGHIWNEPIFRIRDGCFAVHSLESWRRVIDSNLTAAFVMAAHVAARMVRRGGGSIVNFSSVASAGNAGQAAYSGAKAGLEGVTKAMASELGPVRIRVNAIALGFVDVESTRDALSDQQLSDYAGRTPVGRLGRLQDVISAIEFLERNEFVNGAVLKVDGGFRLS
jgi:3-oxoacyl-[acyl-carrier protein] reductase